jgi:type II secretory pathway pseudopilin PulG
LQEQNQSTALVESTAKRVGKTSRYLKYAIGEIVLVVIGILIALSINNWNEERKENIHQRSVLANLLQDLKSDSISYSLNLQGLKDTNFSYDQLYKTGVKNDTTIVISDPNIVRFLINYNPITKENDPFIATKITNDITRKEILIYFRDMTDMDDIYSELDDIMKTKMRTYLGSKKMYKLSSWFENKSSSTTYDVAGPDFIDATELIALSKEPEFQQILFEVSLKIVNTIDILEILIKQNANLIRLIENELNKQ